MGKGGRWQEGDGERASEGRGRGEKVDTLILK